MTTLYIQHPARADSEHALVRFALVADGGTLVQQGEGALRGLADLVASSRHVVLLLAAADVTLLQVKMPPLSSARLKAALPNLVEEQVLGDPDECVLVAAPAQGGDGLRTVAVAQRSWLEALVKSLLAQGARSVSALPFQLCLPIAPGTVSACIGPTGLTIRHGLYQGLGLAMAGEPQAALHTVRALAGDAPLTLYVAQEQLAQYQALCLDAGPAVTLEAEHWAHWIAGSKSTSLDLVPGLGSAGSQTRDWQRWRWPIRLALLALVVNLLALNTQWMRLKRESDATRSAMLQTFRAAYPNEKVISADLELQMRQKNAQTKASFGQVNADEFTYLAAAFGEAARSLGRPPEVVSLVFRERALTIKAKPDSVDPGAGTRLKEALKNRKLDLTELDAGTWLVQSAGAKP